MRLRLNLLVLAVSSLILVSFLLPLALLLRTFAADRAISSATSKAQLLAPLVATLRQPDLGVLVAQVNAQNPDEPTSVFLPGGTVLGPRHASSGGVLLARHGSSFSERVPGGVEVLVAVQGLHGGNAVIRTFVPGRELAKGVAEAWLILGAIALGLMALGVIVTGQLARSMLRPLAAVAEAAELLGAGDLSARAPIDGPPEIRQVSSGLNRLAARIGALLAHERETLADLSHRLRTPLTALRIDAESLAADAERTQVVGDVDALTRTLDQIIREARRPSQNGGSIACDAAGVVRERAAFWRALAEDQDRPMAVDIETDWLRVRVPAQDLAACVDILLENVFSHTPEGSALFVRLSTRASGGAWLVVSDDGPGFADESPARRGKSGGGSTGLGLDIATRIAEASGGSLTIGRSARGGAAVTVGLGPTTAPRSAHRRHERVWRHRPRRARPVDARLAAELSEWSSIVGHDVSEG
jgi:signal transduction histidine kinase